MSGLPPYLIFAMIVVLYLLSSIKILNEYERGVIFRLGKLYPRPKGPGVILVFAPIDRMVRVGLRTIVMDVPPQDVITKDNVSVKVNAVVYFRVMDPQRAIVEVENFHYATSQLAQTTLRSVLGQVELDGLLSEREQLNQELQQILAERARVKQVPPDMSWPGTGRAGEACLPRVSVGAEPSFGICNGDGTPARRIRRWSSRSRDSRYADRPVGCEGVGGRGEARRPTTRYATRDGPASRGRAGEAC